MSTETTVKFENEVCSRCGGTGRFSYNQVDGSRCYGCNGTGVKYTKRGAAAHELYIKLLSKPASEIVAGEKIYCDGIGAGWYVVKSAKVLDSGMVDFDFGQGKGLNGRRCNGSEIIRYAHTNEEKAAKLAKALAYQETLTKTGKPRK